jgi:hypothetical protein
VSIHIIPRILYLCRSAPSSPVFNEIPPSASLPRWCANAPSSCSPVNQYSSAVIPSRVIDSRGLLQSSRDTVRRSILELVDNSAWSLPNLDDRVARCNPKSLWSLVHPTASSLRYVHASVLHQDSLSTVASHLLALTQVVYVTVGWVSYLTGFECGRLPQTQFEFCLVWPVTKSQLLSLGKSCSNWIDCEFAFSRGKL